jgi:hypothetical protein
MAVCYNEQSHAPFHMQENCNIHGSCDAHNSSLHLISVTESGQAFIAELCCFYADITLAAEATNSWPVAAEALIIPRACLMLFVLDKGALGQVFLRVLCFPSVTIIPPIFHTSISFICHRHYTVLLTDSAVKWNISLAHFTYCLYGDSDCTFHEAFTKFFIRHVNKMHVKRISLKFKLAWEKDNFLSEYLENVTKSRRTKSL